MNKMDNLWIATIGVVPRKFLKHFPERAAGAYTNVVVFAGTKAEAIVEINNKLYKRGFAIFRFEDLEKYSSYVKYAERKKIEIEEYLKEQAGLVDEMHPFATGMFQVFDEF